MISLILSNDIFNEPMTSRRHVIKPASLALVAERKNRCCKQEKNEIFDALLCDCLCYCCDCVLSFDFFDVYWALSSFNSVFSRIALHNDMHSEAMTVAFARSLKRSSQLQSTTALKQVFGCEKPFDVGAVMDVIIDAKKIDRHPSSSQGKLALVNMRLCLSSLNFVNAVCEQVIALTKIPFDANNAHHMKLLDTVWDKLRPNIRRSSLSKDSISSDDWSEIGFQGKDPSTDFRGMGLFGLMQLHYLCSEQTQKAQCVLLTSNHPRRFYPMAATSINITAFVVQTLLMDRRNCRLHERVLTASLGNGNVLSHSFSYTATDGGPRSSSALLDVGIAVLHDIYVRVLVAFNDLWEQRDPQDIMQFQNIFGEVKDKFLSEFAPL